MLSRIRQTATGYPRQFWFLFWGALISAAGGSMVWPFMTIYMRQRLGVSLTTITLLLTLNSAFSLAATAIAGPVASLLRFPLLDTLVGLAVAVLILKSAVELAIEIIRSLGEEEADLSRYQMGLAGWYERFRQTQLGDWLLYLVEKEGVQTRDELLAQAREALDFSGHPMLRELGLAQPYHGELIEQGIQELFERGRLAGEERLSLTDAGRKHLRRGMRGAHQRPT